MRNKIPMKGKPNFTSLTDEQLKRMENVLQELLFVYDKDGFPSQHTVLSKAHKDVSDEWTDRLCRQKSVKVQSECSDAPAKMIRKSFKPIKIS